MKVLNIEQRTPEWYAARLGRVTGSSMKHVMAIGARGQHLAAREKYKRQLVAERLTGERQDTDPYVTSAMQWGIINEQVARTNYKLRTGNKVEEVGIVLDEDRMLGVSPDGLVGEDGLLEIKCLNTDNHLYEILRNAMEVVEDEEGDLARLLPDDYKAQVHTQMWVTGRQWCDFVGYDSRLPVGLDMFIVRIPRKESYIELLEMETDSFLREVDSDVSRFMKYLPLTERACRQCGSVFISKLSSCQERECYSTPSKILKVLEPSEYELTKQIEFRSEV